MPYRIIGQAAPFDVMNSYREILLPGSLDHFLTTPDAKKLPMNFRHDRKPNVGEWHNLHIAGGWLHCYGILDDTETEYKVRNGLANELSIGYSNLDVTDAFDAAKTDDERWMAAADSRLGRGIDYIADRISRMPRYEAVLRMAELDQMTDEERRYAAIEACKEHSAIEHVKRARLNEISIVQQGSFSGTRLHWEKI